MSGCFALARLSQHRQRSFDGLAPVSGTGRDLWAWIMGGIRSGIAPGVNAAYSVTSGAGSARYERLGFVRHRLRQRTARLRQLDEVSD